jgi:hypothetical protein
VAFVRKKRVDGKEYYQFVENYREDGKVRQRVLAHLGCAPSVEAAIDQLERYVQNYRRLAAESRERAQEAREQWEAQRNWYREKYPDSRMARATDIPRPSLAQRRTSRLYALPHKRYWECIDRAEEDERRVEQWEEKLETLRGLRDIGKAKPDPPEVREARERERAERLRRLQELQTRAAAARSP